MAVAVNQQGYDVVSAEGERISVKTTAMMGASGYIAFNPKSLSQVDRVMVLRVNTEEMQVEKLFDGSISDAMALMAAEGEGKRVLALSKLVKKARPRSEIKTTNEVRYGAFVLRELESGTIELERDGQSVAPVLPALREFWP
jgi:hypothetical protein